MSRSRIKELAEFGQSIWLDYIDRELLETNKLKNMIAGGLRGLTSNPSIFNNAIGASHDYDDAICSLKEQNKTTFEIYDDLTIKDIQDACDQFKEVYEETGGLDGYVSLEINPHIAHDTQAQIEEGKRLFKAVDRSNVMIKVPATDAGIPVVEELISNGINVNVTLIFSVKQYEDVAYAYYRGLDRLSKKRDDLSGVRSVASVFVSRIDAIVDSDIDKSSNKDLVKLKGKTAVANCHLIFEKWANILKEECVVKLAEKNANVQRILWASTGTKNVAYSDIKYVTELITCPTVNTLPEKTLEAFLDHGEIANALNYDVSQSQAIIDDLKLEGIDIDKVCENLLKAGIVSFDKDFRDLFKAIDKKASLLKIA